VSSVAGLWARAVLGSAQPGDIETLRDLHQPEVAEAFPDPTLGLAALCAAYVDAADVLGSGPVPPVVVDRIERALDAGQRIGSTLPIVLRRARATAARLDGDLPTALREGREALDEAERNGLVVEAAWTHLLLARCADPDQGRHAEAFLALADDHHLGGLVELGVRLGGLATPAGGAGLPAGAGSVAVVVAPAVHGWRASAGSAHQQVARGVLQEASRQVDDFGGRLGTGPAELLVAWFPSVRLGVEFGFRSVSRARRRGASVGVGVERAEAGVTGAEAQSVALGLARLAAADEVLVSGRALHGMARSPGIDFRPHSVGRVDGASGEVEVLRARLARDRR
jgi:hypothetical protein